jgi:hypothetical protein
MYLLKTKGAGKIPDYIQIRDENYFLIAYFKITKPKTALTRCKLLHKMDEILLIANRIGYGKIHKMTL